MLPKPFFRLPLLAAMCCALQGCVVASAVDLAATTVVQTGKIAVKGTGAVVRAVIPDGDNDDKKATQKTKQAQKQREQAARAQAQQPPTSDFRQPETLPQPPQPPMQPEND
ncbi:NF038104 family lipoprotein [Kingella oralis]|uniref:Lipoprotein n=1 Tax=Kingella oralis ATCC 51147 TaxID=629741 RepID=C4GEV6_9NEIS|nr:NF038104 family lipoprotein [Kingella oralis]EEP68761.1 hypothetical protein GCWU000324_00665 [Kingella oralis ATCC 51147]QMT42016.1 NF038104 family lipoprotein [Kingella oralis]